MERLTVLVVDGEEKRRKELVRGLAGHAYEVVAAATADEGRRFAAGIEPDVIVAAAGLVDVTDPLGVRGRGPATGGLQPTMVLLVGTKAGVEVPAGVLLAEVEGLSAEAILRKVHTVLLGRWLGLGSDPSLGSLVGDLEALPLFELLPLLQTIAVTGCVRAGGGELFLEKGEVIAARVDAQRGVKAFARLARTAAGHFRVMVGRPPVARELSEDLLSLMALAMEDQHRLEEARFRLPTLSSRPRLPGAGRLPQGLAPSQREVAENASRSRSVWEVLDRTAAPDGAVLADVARLTDMGVVELDASKAAVRIVTDSTADLPTELATRHEIHVVPLSVTFGRDVYRDGVDLTPEAFFKMATRREGAHAVTGPPAQGEFFASYRMIVERSDVVSVHVSERVSHTVVNARAAAKEGRDEFCRVRGADAPVLEVVDSMQVSTGLALIALMAARMAERGLSAPDIRVRLEAMRPRVHLLFAVDAPEYLARGGRLGRAQAWLGGMLGVKPILGLAEGEIVPVDRVRRAEAAHPRVVELLKQRVDISRPVMVGIGHAIAPVAAVRLRTLMQDTFTVSEVVETEIGPVVGAHVGPGCVGAAMFQPTDEEQPLVAPVTDAW